MSIEEQDEMRRRMAVEYEAKMRRQSSYYGFIMETAKVDPLGAAEMLCTGLMRGNQDTLQLGYSLGSALAATLGQIALEVGQIGALVERIAKPKPGLVEYGPTYNDGICENCGVAASDRERLIDHDDWDQSNA